MKKSAIFIAILFSLFCCKTYLIAQVSVQIQIAPPAIPVYDQPPCPADGYIWTPGYWAYGSDGYYWVPGVWLYPAEIGFLWTPGYWAFENGFYAWNEGYWGPHVGYYGGICYGHGYFGEGYGGGRWEGRTFRYNTAVSNVNRNAVRNVYEDKTVVVAPRADRTSFNGPGGVTKTPSENERAAMKENHVQRTSEQQTHAQTASKDRNQFATVNKGKPSTPAMSKVGEARTQAPAGNSPARRPASTTGNMNAPENNNKPQDQRKNTQAPVQNKQQNVTPPQVKTPERTGEQQRNTNPEPVVTPQPRNNSTGNFDNHPQRTTPQPQEHPANPGHVENHPQQHAQPAVHPQPHNNPPPVMPHNNPPPPQRRE